MDSLRFILRSAVHYRRAHFGTFLGTVIAAAILTGALCVGDSVDFTLRTHALQRLGKVQFAVTLADRLFSQDLGGALQKQSDAQVATVLALPAMAIYQGADAEQRTALNKVQALGVTKEFWALADSAPIELGRREAALNEHLANALGVKVGDTVSLRISKPGLLSRDAPLSSREDDVTARANFTVKAVASDAQLGRFNLSPSQLPPANFYVNLGDLQQLADTEGQASLLLVGDVVSPKVGSAGASPYLEQALEDVWSPAFAGLRVQPRGDGIVQLESDRIFLDEATEMAALELPGAQGALTYLVNTIEKGERLTPYSFMTAAGTLTGDLRDDEIVINAWLAEQLAAQPGDSITIKYYEVLPSNKFVEHARAFTVKRVLSMDEFAIEGGLVPEFPGLSDVENCADWKIGMPMDEKLLADKPNEEYWDQYRTTPKALVTLAAGQAMWTNRFGRLTAVRFGEGADAAALMQSLTATLGPRESGIEVRALREDAENAVAQATDLGGLFLGMSFFLLGSALVLTGLLYAFGAQQRAEEIGVLSAVGYTKRRVRGMMLCEAAFVAAPGALVGAVLGILYAWALMFGLAYAWQDAVGRIPILFHLTAMSLVIGIVATIGCALLTAALTLRRLLRRNVSELVIADFSVTYRPAGKARFGLILPTLLAAAAALLAVYGLVWPPADVAGLFFGSGFLAVVAGLFAARHMLTPRPVRESAPTTTSLALLNAARRRGRSLGIVSALAVGGFLVLAASSMQTDVAANADQRWSGAGGFELYAESTIPILDPAELVAAAPGTFATAIRKLDGDDASCLNLNRAQRPSVLGVNEAELAELGAFGDGAALWNLLNADAGDGVVPALVGDSDTAMWTLKKKTGANGDTLIYRDEAGRDVPVKLVGKLPMRLSVFQGTILISAKHFTEMWPSREGFRVFLMDAPADATDASAERLRDVFSRYGMDVTTTVARLEMFHAVEATYLSMFLVLGGVGLLLGATATGVVVLRNVFERRREVALLRAVGFSPRAVFDLLAHEYGMLLALGAVIGAVASGIAMMPALMHAHGGASPAWRFGVIAFVLGAGLASAYAALVAGLRKTGVDALRAE